MLYSGQILPQARKGIKQPYFSVIPSRLFINFIQTGNIIFHTPLYKQIYLSFPIHLTVWLSCSLIASIGFYLFQQESFVIILLVNTVYFLILGLGNSLLAEYLGRRRKKKDVSDFWKVVILIFPHALLSTLGMVISDFIMEWILQWKIPQMGQAAIVLLYLLTVALAMGGLAIKFWADHQKRVVLEKNLIQAELIALKAQIKPHFLFNSLNTIIVLIRSNPSLAEDILQQLADLLRYILSASENERTTLEREKECIEQYLKIEKARFGDHLNYEIEIDRNWLQKSMPPLILQPLVENCIRHGIAQNLKAGKLQIQITKYMNLWSIAISDNGIGFTPSRLKAPFDSKGHGLRNVSRRWKQFSGYELIVKSKSEKGTTFYLPWEK